jgi:hypothetical protein
MIGQIAAQGDQMGPGPHQGLQTVRRQALDRDRAVPAAAHQLRQPEGVVGVGLV